MRTTETLWEFETKNFLIKLTIEESFSPDTSWMDDNQLEEYENGELSFFDSVCTVYGPIGEMLGQDILGESSYHLNEVESFVTAHRDKEPMNRNCSIMRNKKGKNNVICHYFPDMVRVAIAETRGAIAKRLETYHDLNLRLV